MKDIDFSRVLLHDSTREEFRNPLGAVPTGTRVMFRLKVRDFNFERAYLTVLRGAYKIEIEMHREGEMLFAEFDTPSVPDVVWYWFSIRINENNWLYYGAPAGYTCGVGKVYWNVPPAYQLTVFDSTFKTPDWFKRANLYQIFPDRFKRGDAENLEKGAMFHRSKGRDVIVHEDWNEELIYQPVAGKMYYQPCDYYGGDLVGIEEALDDLRAMGITAVYLNPIFEAASNHRYNTGDYLNIDPILGDVSAFKRLAKQAKEHGIRLILDGVFSHTGDDSVYFNKYGSYDSLGAYQSKESPYYPWYQFMDYPNVYKSWWGFETLPEVDEQKKDWSDFIIEKDDSVIRTWLKRGASGFRLDVADELPDNVIEAMRTALKDVDTDNVLLGEVWEDATTKQSYGVNRTYALGRGLDSVMNYPFANATIEFVSGGMDAFAYQKFLISQSQNYPKEMYYALMNLLSSHDIARMRTRLATHNDGKSLSREQQARFVVTEEQDRYGAILQKIAVAIQFSIPGVPAVYYGDETGMNGLMDPFNRRTYQEFDLDTKEYYTAVSKIRRRHEALQMGHYAFIAPDKDTLGILRLCSDSKDAFGNYTDDEMILTVINRSTERHKVVVDLFADHQALPKKFLDFFKEVSLKTGKSLLNKREFPISEGLIQVDIEAQSADIVEVLWV